MDKIKYYILQLSLNRQKIPLYLFFSFLVFIFIFLLIFVIVDTIKTKDYADIIIILSSLIIWCIIAWIWKKFIAEYFVAAGGKFWDKPLMIISFFVILIGVKGVSKFIIRPELVKQTEILQIEKKLENVSTEINKTTPIIIDKNWRIESTNVQGKSIIYKCVSNTVSLNNMDIEEFRKQAEMKLKNEYNNNPGMKYFKDNEIVVIFKYFDKSGSNKIELKAP